MSDLNAIGNSLEIPFRTIGESFRHFIEHHPKKIAIVSVDQGFSLDFKRLNDLVERSARAMLELGVKPGDRVAILSGECVEKLVLMFATWRCGASACPFHTEIHSDHLKDILKTINPALVVWRQDMDGLALTEGLNCSTSAFSQLNESKGFFSFSGNLLPFPSCEREYGPGDEGCIFATSGTTDRPKCVVWDHLGLWMCGLSTISFTAMNTDDRILEYRTFSWLSPQIVTFMPFISLGLTIVVAEKFSRSHFFEWVRDHKITVAVGVPTVINLLLDHPVQVSKNETKTLRLMTASSAPLAEERWRQFQDLYGIPLLQFYGASEGGWLCGNRQDKCKIGTAGPPARHMDLAILDKDGNICPPGVEGEITIRGPQTAIATVTAEGLWEDRSNFWLKVRTRVGDLGFIDEEGFVVVTGRIKDVILRGGVSIAPLEIDAAIMKHPLVYEAAAIGVPDAIWGEEVACCIVLAEGEGIKEDHILNFAAGLLPENKRPKSVFVFDDLPKNERGKVKRDELKLICAGGIKEHLN